jgi:aspartate/methionine/tyrosine aminotransferase
MVRKSINPFQVMEILARARELEAAGRSIIHMEIGEPDFPTPAPVVEAATRAVAAGHVPYAQAAGIPQLREAIADYYAERYRVDVSPRRVIVTPGASGALTVVIAALVTSGDEVLVTDPGYPCYRHIVELMGGNAVAIALDAKARYAVSADMLRQRWNQKTRALIIASPSNPTGAITDTVAFDSIARFVHSRGGVVIADEIYHGLTYRGDVQTALGDGVVVINSFSKYFGMTGWRLGWLVVPEQYAQPLESLMQNLFLASSTVAQRAALAAFLPETRAILEERRAEFRRRRDMIVPALREIGFDIPHEPDGAFYVYAESSQFARDSASFCKELLERAGVAITPGGDFGRHKAREHVRFAYTASLDKLTEGMERLQRFVATRR